MSKAIQPDYKQVIEDIVLTTMIRVDPLQSPIEEAEERFERVCRVFWTFVGLCKSHERLWTNYEDADLTFV